MQIKKKDPTNESLICVNIYFWFFTIITINKEVLYGAKTYTNFFRI